MRHIIVILIIGLLAGCAGKVYTVINPEPDSNGRIDGVIVYQPKPLIFVIETTQAQDKNGNVVGRSDDESCIPVESFEVSSIPDYTKPYAIGYETALFESKKFSLELDKGVVTKINNESTSVAKDVLDVFQVILGTVKEIKEIKVLKYENGVPACNAGKKIVGQIDIADVPKVEP